MTLQQFGKPYFLIKGQLGDQVIDFFYDEAAKELYVQFDTQTKDDYIDQSFVIIQCDRYDIEIPIFNTKYFFNIFILMGQSLSFLDFSECLVKYLLYVKCNTVLATSIYITEYLITHFSQQKGISFTDQFSSNDFPIARDTPQAKNISHLPCFIYYLIRNNKISDFVSHHRPENIKSLLSKIIYYIVQNRAAEVKTIDDVIANNFTNFKQESYYPYFISIYYFLTISSDFEFKKFLQVETSKVLKRQSYKRPDFVDKTFEFTFKNLYISYCSEKIHHFCGFIFPISFLFLNYNFSEEIKSIKKNNNFLYLNEKAYNDIKIIADLKIIDKKTFKMFEKFKNCSKIPYQENFNDSNKPMKDIFKRLPYSMAKNINASGSLCIYNKTHVKNEFIYKVLPTIYQSNLLVKTISLISFFLKANENFLENVKSSYTNNVYYDNVNHIYNNLKNFRDDINTYCMEILENKITLFDLYKYVKKKEHVLIKISDFLQIDSNSPSIETLTINFFCKSTFLREMDQNELSIENNADCLFSFGDLEQHLKTFVCIKIQETAHIKIKSKKHDCYSIRFRRIESKA